MRLVRLGVEDFLGVISAQVEFGPGLNVLYGPNELGKSSLAEAIRAGLLLPPTSAAHERYLGWRGAGTPAVELIFTTAPGQIWRLKKAFGHGTHGTATLDESKDGINFNNVARGRRVDGEIRKLLSWGIPEPGGSGGPKGLPETFLSVALLGQQGQATRVFQMTLDGDYDGSGHKRLTDALQALAADPLFSKVLATVQERVDEAFTPKGEKKRSVGAPFRRISDDIKQADEQLRTAQELLSKSQGVERSLQQFLDQRLFREQEFQEAKVELAKLCDAWRQRVDIEQRLTAAQAELANAHQVHGSVQEKEGEARHLQQQLDTLNQRMQHASDAVQTAEQSVRKTSQELELIANQENVAQRKIQQQAMEKHLLELEAARRDADTLSTRAQAVKDGLDKVAQLQADQAALVVQIETSRTQFTTLDQQERARRAELDQLDRLETWLKWQDATHKLRRFEEQLQTIVQLRKDEGAKRTEAEKIRVKCDAMKMPSPDRLAELRQLDAELRLAEARLDVGLSVAVQPHKPFVAKVATDGGKMKTHRIKSEAATFQAARLIKLALEDIAEITVIGGAVEAREQTIHLRDRWTREVQPVLTLTGLSNCDELEAACRAAAERTQCRRDLIREADAIAERIQAMGDLGGQAEEIKQTVQEYDQSLAKCDRDALALMAAKTQTDAKSLASCRKELETRLATVRRDLDVTRGMINKLEAQADAKRDSLEPIRQAHREGAVQLGEDWAAGLARAESMRKTIADETAQIQQQLRKLTEEDQTVMPKAKARLTQAETELAAAKEAQKDAEKKRSDAVETLAHVQGELKARRESAAAVDLAAALAKAAAARAELDQLPADTKRLSEPLVDDKRHQVETLKAAVDAIDRDITREEGALKHVGGDVARERRAGYAEALAVKREREVEMERDYDAWKLLLDELRVAENDQAAHLGQALLPTLSPRIAELTRTRYGQLELGANLKTGGIDADGQTRTIDILSVGVQEQLSTLMRVALAEQLGCSVLLDDQLVQSDSDRMRWFRELLRQAARAAQIIVLTCHPNDYLAPSELPCDDASLKDSADRLVRAVNLQRLVRSRSPLEARRS